MKNASLPKIVYWRMRGEVVWQRGRYEGEVADGVAMINQEQSYFAGVEIWSDPIYLSKDAIAMRDEVLR